MRLCYALLTAAASLLASSDVVSAAKGVELIGGLNQLRSLDTVNEKANRFLISHEKLDADTIESWKDEERVPLDRVVSDLTDDAAKVAVKLTRSKSLSSLTLDEEIVALKKAYQSIKKRIRRFNYLATEREINPKKMMDTLDIKHNLKSMTMEQLASDPKFLLWKTYTKFWNKYYYAPY